MQRRRFLAAAGLSTGAALGGCLGQSNPDDPVDSTPTDRSSPTDTSEPTTTARPTPDGVEVSNVVVRDAVYYRSIMGSGGVLAGTDRQYVVASVRADRSLSAESFSFETETNSWSPGLPDTRGATNRSVAGHGEGPVGQFNDFDSPTYLAFTVPAPLSAETAHISLSSADSGPWPLSETGLERLGSVGPRFELDSLSVPSSVSQGEQLSVSLTVRNVSEAEGRFLAAVYWPTQNIADDDESHRLEGRVPAGETATESVQIDTAYTTREAGPVKMRVEGYVDAERTVGVTDVSEM